MIVDPLSVWLIRKIETFIPSSCRSFSLRIGLNDCFQSSKERLPILLGNLDRCKVIFYSHIGFEFHRAGCSVLIIDSQHPSDRKPYLLFLFYFYCELVSVPPHAESHAINV